MKGRQRVLLGLNLLLVLVAALLEVTANYAANQSGASLLGRVVQRGALPGIAVLLLVMVFAQVIVYRLEHPAAPRRQWDPGRTPYPGLEAFAEDEAAVFFGRDGAIGELVQLLHAGRRFVVVAGASGSGKSSVVQAGLIPRLRGRRWMVLPVLTPGSDPVGALARTLEVGDVGPSLLPLVEGFRRSRGRRSGTGTAGGGSAGRAVHLDRRA